MTQIDAAGGQADVAALAERVRLLEAENARLSDATPRRTTDRRGWWRGLLSAVVIVIATILVPVSIVTGWARLQLVDEEAFVATMAPLVDDPSVQGMIIDETVDAINAQVDFDQLTANVFDGIVDLGLPPRAAQALGLLQAPAADGLRGLVSQTVTRVVESDAFSDVWAGTTRAAHRALTTAATSDGGGLVVRTDDGVGIQLGAIVERVKENLVDRGVGIAQLIPAVDRVIIIGEGNNLALIRTGYALANVVGWWLPVITLALFGLGILIARRRSTAVLGTGIGLAVGGGTLAITLAIGGAAVGAVAGSLDISASALDVIYAQLVDSMRRTGLVIAVLGVFVALLGWIMGRSRAADSVRGTVRGLNAAARTRLAARGLDTGAFGTWLARYRVLVRTLIAVLAVVWMLSLRPLSFGDVVLVIVVAILVAWALELLQKRTDEQPDVDGATAGVETTDASADESAEASIPVAPKTGKC
ncbi:hypothetical protein [Microbacterium sp.]|uniref:hypothetical protein n=1 Tax=Microbacterium sp. TaxID=51671 RepID=UPI003F7000BF